MALGIEILMGSNGMDATRIINAVFYANYSGSMACIFSSCSLSESCPYCLMKQANLQFGNC